jgi:FkbM family methyltransferase
MNESPTSTRVASKSTHFFARLAEVRNLPRPMRFLASRLLWHSGLCALSTIPCGSYRLRFYPTAYSAMLWLNPDDRLPDEKVIHSLLQEGDVVIDVGANVGAITLAASRVVGPSGRVYAIEAHPRTHKCLVGNLHLNDTHNVQTFNVACGCENGTVMFSDKRSDDQNRVSAVGLSIPVRRLDDLIDGTEQIKLLKIDVEGYEKFVLEGASHLLPRVKFIYFESWERHFANFGYKLRNIVDLLRRFNFQVKHLNGQRIFDDYDSPFCENLLAERISS